MRFQGLLVLVLTSKIRRFFNPKVWQGVHVISFIVYYAILFQGHCSGTDSPRLWTEILYFITGPTVSFLFWRRLLPANWFAKSPGPEYSPTDYQRQRPFDKLK
jgi:hypothetical protein